MNEYKLYLGNCLDHLEFMPDNSVDRIVTDPPYGLSFMGKKWDYDVPSVEIWAECLRVLKPGGYLLSFAGTRTQHRMAINIEDAGFEIRDMIAWVYGSGFPKSMDVSKAIDKAAGAKREVVGEDPQAARRNKNTSKFSGCYGSIEDKPSCPLTAPATEEAKQWGGWGTALKPALEPITVARKPFKGTIAANVQAHGTGGLNIDGCRVGDEVVSTHSRGANGAFPKRPGETSAEESGRKQDQREGLDHSERNGRWPANLIHDGSDKVLAAFPYTASGKAAAGGHRRTAENMEKGSTVYGGGRGIAGTSSTDEAGTLYGDSGSAARFFYCAKASRKDRNEGMQDPGPQFQHGTTLRKVENTCTTGNNHPTVKPTDLMAYLCRLVTPPGGIVLDPFMGSGSTGKAAIREGFQFVGIEMDPEYLAIAEARIKHEANKNTR